MNFFPFIICFFEYAKKELHFINERSIYFERNIINFRNNRTLADADNQCDLNSFYESTLSLANKFNDCNDGDEEITNIRNAIDSQIKHHKENNTLPNLNNVDKKTKKIIYELQKEFEEVKKYLDNERNDELATQPIQNKKIIKKDKNIPVSKNEHFKQLENYENALVSDDDSFEDYDLEDYNMEDYVLEDYNLEDYYLEDYNLEDELSKNLPRSRPDRYLVKRKLKKLKIRFLFVLWSFVTTTFAIYMTGYWIFAVSTFINKLISYIEDLCSGLELHFWELLFEVKGLGSNNKCDIPGISIIVISISIILKIMYKYLPLECTSKSKRKKNMKKVINSIGGKRPIQIIIKSFNTKKMISRL
ncbi:fam-b protein [Plasmodium vinckei brucechwatti]|uniref:Fam-b protein n=1 Tax=Plasmodium vinckei brucechwatti TaxID=119398 RepID=A0A6V7RZ14_PLAVN|nr:fam-b protein [Plasmodium vinckei brucechwatti]